MFPNPPPDPRSKRLHGVPSLPVRSVGLSKLAALVDFIGFTEFFGARGGGRLFFHGGSFWDFFFGGWLVNGIYIIIDVGV